MSPATQPPITITYRLEHEGTRTFRPLDGVLSGTQPLQFTFDGTYLHVDVHGRFTTVETAREICDAVVAVWSRHLHLEEGLNAARFRFNSAKTEPPPGVTAAIELGGSIVISGELEVSLPGLAASFQGIVLPLVRDLPPPPPVSRPDPLVERAWGKWEQYLNGASTLLSASYAVLHLIEKYAVGQGYASPRAAVCHELNMDLDVREQWGDLSSDFGSDSEARKLRVDERPPLTAAEVRFVRAVTTVAIQRLWFRREHGTPPPRRLSISRSGDGVVEEGQTA